MRCYDDELMFDRIENKEDYHFLLSFYIKKYNTWYNIYLDSYYMLNDPISELDSKAFREELIDKHNRAKRALSLYIREIHSLIYLLNNK